MRLLLDTHIWLWWHLAHPRITDDVRRTLDAANVAVSAVSLWEITVKHALGKLALHREPRPWFREASSLDGFVRMEISFDDVLAVGELPAHHRDPFDRLLIAQAIVSGRTIVTADAAFAQYPVPLVHVA